jgi:hypothetical protein
MEGGATAVDLTGDESHGASFAGYQAAQLVRHTLLRERKLRVELAAMSVTIRGNAAGPMRA